MAVTANVNRGKNSKVVKAMDIYPLSIDVINNEVNKGFDFEAADKLMQAAKKAKWVK